MCPDLSYRGFGFRLRPVTIEDAGFIFSLRSNPDLTRFLQDGPRTLEDQIAWMQKRAQKSNDYYFIVEKEATGAPEGTIALYNFTHDLASAEWGRWILRPGSLAAAASAYLIYAFGFEKTSVDYIYGMTNVENVQTVSFHDRSGISRRRVIEVTMTRSGRPQALMAVEHGCHRDEWPSGVPLRETAQGVARILGNRSAASS